MPKQVESAATLSVRLWRGKTRGRFHDYVVPSRANQTISMWSPKYSDCMSQRLHIASPVALECAVPAR